MKKIEEIFWKKRKEKKKWKTEWEKRWKKWFCIVEKLWKDLNFMPGLKLGRFDMFFGKKMARGTCFQKIVKSVWCEKMCDAFCGKIEMYEQKKLCLGVNNIFQPIWAKKVDSVRNENENTGFFEIFFYFWDI